MNGFKSNDLRGSPFFLTKSLKLGRLTGPTLVGHNVSCVQRHRHTTLKRASVKSLKLALPSGTCLIEQDLLFCGTRT